MPSFTDNTASSGITYYYVVTAVNNTVEGPNSNQASAIISSPSHALIPVMTDDTHPSGIASASTNNTDAWKPMAELASDTAHWWVSSTEISPWLQYQFPSAVIATGVTFTVTNGAANRSGLWRLDGSNNGTSWTTLTSSSSVDASTLVVFSNSTAYLYYRITVPQVSSSFAITLGGVQLYN